MSASRILFAACPGCRARLRVKTRQVTKTIPCPKCGGSVTAGDPDVDPPITRQSVDDRPPAHWFADQPAAAPSPTDNGWDPVEPATAPSALAEPESTAEVEPEGVYPRLAHRKEVAPPVPTIYKPSGRLPASGVLGLLAGALLGLPVFAIVRTIMIVGGVFALEFIAGILSPKDQTMAIVMLIVLGLFTLFYIGMTYVAAGIAAGATTTWLGKFGQNRSVPAAVAASVGSSAVAVLILWIVAMTWGVEMAKEGGQDVSTSTLEAVVTIEALLGGIFAAFAAAMYADQAVRAAKFCEPCERYLVHTTIANMPFAGARPVADDLRDGDVSTAVDRAEQAGKGTEATLEWHRCPKCRGGILEVAAHYEASWKEGNSTKKLKETWLVASVQLTADEAEPLATQSTSA